MNKTRAFRILIPAALALTSAGFAQASADEVPRMSNDVYRMSVSFCSNVAAAEKIECGDMIAAGSRIVAAIGGLPPASATSIDEGARSKLPAAERRLAPVEPGAIDRTTTLPVSPAWCVCATSTNPGRRRARGIMRR